MYRSVGSLLYIDWLSQSGGRNIDWSFVIRPSISEDDEPSSITFRGSEVVLSALNADYSVSSLGRSNTAEGIAETAGAD